MLVRLLLACVMISLIAVPSTVAAQRGAMTPSRHVAEMVAVCMTQELGEEFTGPAWVEELVEGYRVVLPLRGDPILHRNAQFPPQAVDTLGWIDLHRYDEPSRAPPGLVTWPRNEKFYARSFRVEFLTGDRTYVVELGGYDWYTLGWMTVRCLDRARGIL